MVYLGLLKIYLGFIFTVGLLFFRGGLGFIWRLV